ncbi:hypothetical protein D3C84_1123900 [compost metagenome]
MVGDVVPAGVSSREVSFHAEDLCVGDIVKLISNKGVVKEVEVAAQGELHIQLDANGASFVRAEIWRHFHEVGQLLLAAVTNPIYFD